MQFIADLHIHSRHSRATSKSLDLQNLEKWAKVKGVNLLGTGDFTHPQWIKELKNSLTEENGILKTKTGFPFVWQTEISLIYTHNNKGRKVHLVILAPNYEIVSQITDYLKSKGRVDYDGRPIFGISCVEFVENLKKISEKIEIIPAHIFTPWFSLFGSNSGFDSVQECFQDQTKHIHALETGLSSDPAMNWRLSQLDKYALVSFSDLHSFWPWRIGREATVFDLKKLTYDNLLKALRTKESLVSTVEVNPFFGKYHLSGHRLCNVCLDPAESLKLKNICPKCSRKLTVGVAERVEELADRPEGFKPKGAVPFKTLIPLSELLSKILKSGVATNKVWKEYYKIVNHFGSEYKILLEASKEELNKVADERIVKVILTNREGKIKVKGGYDGVYGVPIIDEDTMLTEEEIKPRHKQRGLNEFIKN